MCKERTGPNMETMMGNDNEIKVGDVVQLKSGGPLMTVEGKGILVGPYTNFTCTWFDGSTRMKDEFSAAILEKA